MNKLQKKYSPKINLEKLGEYLAASPRGRRRVIKSLKRKRKFVSTSYKQAEKIISKYIAYGEGHDELVLNEIKRLEKKIPVSDLDEQKDLLCIEAMELFLDIADEISINEFDSMKEDPTTPTSIMIAGVTIDINPEIILRNLNLETGSKVGAIKIYFSKNYPLSRNAGYYMSTILYQYLEEHLGDVGEPDHSHCYVIDVFNQKVYETPRAHKRYRADVQAACEEIARAWAFLKKLTDKF